jgi:two-component sensor histidine kinase
VNCQNPRFSDADGDNKPEIFGLMSASGNYKVPTPYSDMSTWFMVFDEELNLEFPPGEFPGLTNRLDIYPYSAGDFRGFILSHNTATADTSVLEPRLLIYSGDGRLVKDKVFSKLGMDGYVTLHPVNSLRGVRIFLFEKEVIELNDRLEIVNKITAPFSQAYYSYVEDIDLNGTEEIVLYSAGEEKLIVLNTSLQLLAEANLKTSDSELKFSHSISAGNRNRLFVTSSDNAWFIEMKKNNLFYLGYLAYPGIYLILVLFIDGINRINTYNVRQKESLKQRLLTLQLQGIKSQLDPHFTFNALNSIASLIYLDDRQSAYDNMNKFTMLLRSMLNDADKIYRSLGEEIDFVTTYLELEKLRFGNKFNFTIEISDEVSQKEQVPKLVLQTFAENAIKHGLMPCIDGGILKITATREDDYLKLTIEDNGVGREKSSGRSTSTGKGLKLTGEFYDILNQLNKQAIIHTLTDLYDENGAPAGTRVEVWVPLSV